MVKCFCFKSTITHSTRGTQVGCRIHFKKINQPFLYLLHTVVVQVFGSGYSYKVIGFSRGLETDDNSD